MNMTYTFKKISIIVPAYNEANTIRKLVEKIFSVSFQIDFELVIVDDHSNDRTFRIAKILQNRNLNHQIKLLRNDPNQGKGFSIVRGVENATGDLMVIQDADFEYDPHEIPMLIQPILDGKTQVVFGSRFMH